MFSLYYIVIALEAGQYFVGRFQNLAICIINLYILQGIFGLNLSIDSTTKYFQLSRYVIQLLKINMVAVYPTVLDASETSRLLRLSSVTN